MDVFYLFDYLWFFVLIVLAGITKSAQMPFSSWLPAAMAAPTPVSSLVHSSTLVTAGVYMYIRFFFLFDNLYFLSFFGLLFLVTSFSAGLFACCEIDLKKLVAMSTLSQLGIIMVCLRVAHIYYSFFHMVSHALFKSLLFLTCGLLIIYGLGLQDIRSKGRKVFSSYSLMLLLLISNLSLCGVPFISGFFSKDLIIETVILTGLSSWCFHIFVLSCLFSIVYSYRLVVYGLINSNLSVARLIGSFHFLKKVFMLCLGFWAISLGKVFCFLFLEGEYSLFFALDKLIGVVFFLLFFFYHLKLPL